MNSSSFTFGAGLPRRLAIDRRLEFLLRIIERGVNAIVLGVGEFRLKAAAAGSGHPRRVDIDQRGGQPNSANENRGPAASNCPAEAISAPPS